MSFRVDFQANVLNRITLWQLPDEVLVEVHLRVCGLKDNPADQRERTENGMEFHFSMVDPHNRLCEHFFSFQVVYSMDEEALIVIRGGHLRLDGV